MPLDRDTEAAYKVLVLGESGVGKSALLHSLTGKPFRQAVITTVAVDFVTKIFEVDGALVQLKIWDTAGQEKFRSITLRQFKRVQGVIMVYDITRRPTFDLVTYWLSTIQNGLRQPHSRYEPIPVVLCGNKADMADHRQVASFRAEELTKKELLFQFYETSAKTGQNVFQAFHRLAYFITDICHPKLMKSYHPYSIRAHEMDMRPTIQQPSSPLMKSEDTNSKVIMAAKTKQTKTKQKKKKKKGCFRPSWLCSCVKGVR